MEKNMRMKFLKQRITVILLLVASVCICGSINEFYVFENDYYLPLAEFFREIANKELECKVSGFSSEARKALLTHSWPGNVRELRQKIMGAVLQAQTGLVTKEHLELGITETTSVTGFSLRNDEEDKERILRALKQADGNRKVAAELLGIGRTTLYNKLEEYGLKYKFEQP